MPTILPTPKSLKENSTARRPLPLMICTEHETWKEHLPVFAELFGKVFGQPLDTDAIGGIALLFDPSLRKNAYRLDTSESVKIYASDSEGLCYALATLLQLVRRKDDAFEIDDVTVEDYPDKEFRCLMTDLAREWHPFPQVLKFVDLCFLYKIRYLHLHLMDDQSYTLPSGAFPNVSTEGRHYTFEEIAYLNRYAEERGVLLIPEFECPGHAASLNRAYPEIFSNRSDGEGGVFYTELGAVVSGDSLLCAGREAAWEGVYTLLREVCELFPNAPYVHIGGDEAIISLWNQCPDCRAYMKKHDLADVYELYSDYVARATDFVLSLGKTPMVWEGFPKAGAERISKETVVIAWETHYHMPDELLAEGFRIVNASWQPLYLVPSLTKRWTPFDILAWNVYNWQHWWPNSASYLNPITVPETENVLGATMCSWEMTYDQESGRVMENLSAFSERTWTVRRVLSDSEYNTRFKKLYPIASRLIGDH